MSSVASTSQKAGVRGGLGTSSSSNNLNMPPINLGSRRMMSGSALTPRGPDDDGFAPTPPHLPMPSGAQTYRGIRTRKELDEDNIKSRTPRGVSYRSTPFKYPTPMSRVELESQQKAIGKTLLSASYPTPYKFFFPELVSTNVIPQRGSEPISGFDEVPHEEHLHYTYPNLVPKNLAVVVHHLSRSANSEGRLDNVAWFEAMQTLTDLNDEHTNEVAVVGWDLLGGDTLDYIDVTSVMSVLEKVFNTEGIEDIIQEMFLDFTQPDQELILKSHLNEMRVARTERNHNSRAMVASLLRAIHAHPRFSCDRRQFLSFDEFKRFFMCDPDRAAIEAWTAQQGKGKKKSSSKKNKNQPILPEPPSVEATEIIGSEMVAAFLPKLLPIMKRKADEAAAKAPTPKKPRKERL